MARLGYVCEKCSGKDAVKVLGEDFQYLCEGCIAEIERDSDGMVERVAPDETIEERGERREFEVTVSVSGRRTYTVMATDEDDARERFDNGDHEFIDEDVTVDDVEEINEV